MTVSVLHNPTGASPSLAAAHQALKLAEAQERLAELAATQPELAPFVEFLGASERSIIR